MFNFELGEKKGWSIYFGLARLCDFLLRIKTPAITAAKIIVAAVTSRY